MGKRHRVDISLQAKFMLKEIGEQFEGLSQSELTELCIQSVYDRMLSGEVQELSEINPSQEKLDRIIFILEEIRMEI